MKISFYLTAFRDCICVWSNEQWQDIYHERFRWWSRDYSSSSQRSFWQDTEGKGKHLSLAKMLWLEHLPSLLSFLMIGVWTQIADREFLIRVSYMEIYNEDINDLLSVRNQKLTIHESLEVSFLTYNSCHSNFSMHALTFYFHYSVASLLQD